MTPQYFHTQMSGRERQVEELHQLCKVIEFRLCVCVCVGVFVHILYILLKGVRLYWSKVVMHAAAAPDLPVLSQSDCSMSISANKHRLEAKAFV